MKKLTMPTPHLSVDPESSLFQTSDDARTLARAHSVLRSPARLKAVQTHLADIGGLIKTGIKKVPIKGIGIRSIGVKR